MENITEFQIIISERAEEKLDNIIDYLDNEWNEKVKSDFIKKFKKTISFLRINPFMYPIFIQEKKIRKCLITKHNSIYYKVDNNVVKIISIYGSMQNPKLINLD